jgi:hypothetical protein
LLLGLNPVDEKPSFGNSGFKTISSIPFELSYGIVRNGDLVFVVLFA